MGVQAGERGLDLKRAVVGRPLASHQLDETLLRKLIALPVFASDPLSSVAYATEAAMVVLVGVSLSALHLVLPISAAIAALLGIVVLSYRQTVRAYETSGGAYVVAKDNLGTLPSLVAAAALLTDYILTVAVSVAAGVFAITSAAPSLGHLKVELSLLFIVLLTVANLRGVKEAGILFAIPTYGFVLAIFAMIGTGAARCVAGTCPHAVAPHPVAAGAGAVSFFLLLKAFASGSAALTGVEAISNGVSAFRPPQSRNAARTLAAMGAIAIVLFMGVSYLAVQMHARPSETVSVLSQIARATFPAGSAGSFVYFAIQALTFAILVLAANTSFQGFPRLGALLARDRFFPRQFVNLGDRLVYSNGILVLSSVAAGLILVFGANVDSLIHLYVIGVFTAFTLSQAGMVRYWHRRGEPRWRRRVAVNAVGATATGVVLLVVVWTKFAEGAWAVIVFVPLLVASFYGIRRHYRKVARRLRAGTAAVAAAPPATNTMLVHVHELDDATKRAVWFARAASERFRGLYVAGSAPLGHDPRGRWWEVSGGADPLEVLPPEEGHVGAVLEHVWTLPRGESQFVTVVVPEQFRRRSLLSALGRTEFRLKLKLLSEPSVVIADVPAVQGESCEPTRAVCRVLVSGAHAASLRAVRYAETLGLDARAAFFAFDAEEARSVRRAWERAGFTMPLDTFEAPYRDLGEPLRDYVRGLTADEETLAVVVLPELVVRGWARLLHNQRALYVKRLLLFEPRVVLASVPYHLR